MKSHILIYLSYKFSYNKFSPSEVYISSLFLIKIFLWEYVGHCFFVHCKNHFHNQDFCLVF